MVFAPLLAKKNSRMAEPVAYPYFFPRVGAGLKRWVPVRRRFDASMSEIPLFTLGTSDFLRDWCAVDLARCSRSPAASPSE